MQDPDRILCEQNTDGVLTDKQESKDDNRDATMTANEDYAHKERLNDPSEVGSITGYAERQLQPVVHTHMNGSSTPTNIPTIEPGTSKRQKATLPASNLSQIEESQQTFEANNIMSKVLQELERMDKRLNSLEKRMELVETSAKIGNNNSDASSKNLTEQMGKGTIRLNWNLPVAVNDPHNNNTKIRDDSVLSECGVHSGDSNYFKHINQIAKDEQREQMQINNNGDVEFSQLHQASPSSLANTNCHQIESLHHHGPLFGPNTIEEWQWYRQSCKSFIQKSVSHFYTRQEVVTSLFRDNSKGNARRAPLSPNRLRALLEEARRMYPGIYQSLSKEEIADAINSKCHEIGFSP